jgi:hypothetical protein
LELTDRCEVGDVVLLLLPGRWGVGCWGLFPKGGW